MQNLFNILLHRCCSGSSCVKAMKAALSLPSVFSNNRGFEVRVSAV